MMNSRTRDVILSAGVTVLLSQGASSEWVKAEWAKVKRDIAAGQWGSVVPYALGGWALWTFLKGGR
jgi:hypothetical protein